MWIDSLDFAHVTGEVKNTGDVWLRFVEITGTLRDATNAIVDVVFAYTLLDMSYNGKGGLGRRESGSRVKEIRQEGNGFCMISRAHTIV